MLVAKVAGNRIEAAIALKGQDYHCPHCGEAVILKKGRIRTPHFAHKPPVSCSWAKGETAAHLEAKTRLKDAFLARGLRVEVECEVDTLPGDRRADVMVWSPKGTRFAIELQHTPIGLSEIEERTESYHRAGVGVIWVGFLHPAVWKAAEARGGGQYVVRRYSARPWERWTHGYNYGHVWLYDPAQGCLWQGRLNKHEIYVEESNWYDSDGNENYSGGYTRVSKRWRELILQGPVPLDAVKIEPFRRKPIRLGNNNYPGGRSARFVAA